MRSGAGLVTIGIPQSLNSTLQKKISSVIMTLSLKETKNQSLSLDAYSQIRKDMDRFDVIALGPGLSRDISTQKLILKIIGEIKKPMIIDADALFALSKQPSLLKKISTIKILTPHTGEMARLTGLNKKLIEKDRTKVTRDFAKKYQCTLVLKGPKTVIVSKEEKTAINSTGNAGMATAGSGDVLTGILAAFLAQGLNDFDAAKLGVYLHGKAGDWAAQKKTKAALIATDIIETLPQVFKKLGA